MSAPDYKQIYQHYENCLEKHGSASPKAMDWPDAEGMITRFKVMSDVVKTTNTCSLLDLGCGTGAFYSYLKLHAPHIQYTGMDISQKFIDVCKNKYPQGDFQQVDILVTPEKLNCLYDYVIMNGIFTMKMGLTQEAMLDFLAQMLLTIFPKVKKGLAFNTMSKNVDWERNDLFHLSHDLISNFICKNLGTRNFVFRNDYGLYEYTTYVYKL